MKELSERDDFTITKAGKGGAVITVGVKDYINVEEDYTDHIFVEGENCIKFIK